MPAHLLLAGHGLIRAEEGPVPIGQGQIRNAGYARGKRLGLLRVPTPAAQGDLKPARAVAAFAAEKNLDQNPTRFTRLSQGIEYSSENGQWLSSSGQLVGRVFYGLGAGRSQVLRQEQGRARLHTGCFYPTTTPIVLGYTTYWLAEADERNTTHASAQRYAAGVDQWA